MTEETKEKSGYKGLPAGVRPSDVMTSQVHKPGHHHYSDRRAAMHSYFEGTGRRPSGRDKKRFMRQH